MYIWCGDDDSDFHREKHTVGDYAKWHPHIHAIVADGLFHRRGVFYVMAKVPVKPLGVFALLRLSTERFRARVLAMLKREGLIGDTFIANLMKWRHTSGFSVHNSVRIAAKDETGITNLAQYIMRSPFSTAKLNYNSSTGMVTYRSGKHP
jgi:hypothetical protein